MLRPGAGGAAAAVGLHRQFAILTGILNPGGLGRGPVALSPGGWALLAALLLSGFATVLAMARAGIRSLWNTTRSVPVVGVVEIAPVLLLLGLCVAMTAAAGPVTRYMQATAASLHAPQDYVRSVMVPRP
ncbi:hypothetical protein ACFQY5_16500 [Paeniroseomonas aquatica]|uniref:hypothetical protein n=1 Tax=Paeniroseomonas aquatica TaxID=373043 RepID=UPI00361BB09B